ncbi:hypothetical protein P692DRAFT_20757113, partial [Suillus brevipes Sb2]
RQKLAKAKREMKKTFAERDNVAAAHQSLLRTTYVVLQCPICQAVIERPFMARLSYCVKERLPERFQHHLAPFTTAEVKELCDGLCAIIPGRFYTCPTCPAHIEKPPVEIPLLREVVGKITEAHGADIECAKRRVPTNPAAQWGVFFE